MLKRYFDVDKERCLNDNKSKVLDCEELSIGLFWITTENIKDSECWRGILMVIMKDVIIIMIIIIMIKVKSWIVSNLV